MEKPRHNWGRPWKATARLVDASDLVGVRASWVHETREQAMWDKNDWHQFFAIASKPWQRRRPPRPVYPSGTKRVLPAVGFSLSELDDAGINMEAAYRLGLPVDAARIGAYGPNVSALREFVRSARQPGKLG